MMNLIVDGLVLSKLINDSVPDVSTVHSTS